MIDKWKKWRCKPFRLSSWNDKQTLHGKLHSVTSLASQEEKMGFPLGKSFFEERFFSTRQTSLLPQRLTAVYSRIVHCILHPFPPSPSCHFPSPLLSCALLLFPFPCCQLSWFVTLLPVVLTRACTFIWFLLLAFFIFICIGFFIFLQPSVDNRICV